MKTKSSNSIATTYLLFSLLCLTAISCSKLEETTESEAKVDTEETIENN